MGNPGKKKVTLKDISIATGFTINTVSHALKDKNDISPETKRSIQETAKRMGYIGNALASSLRSGNTKTIAIILGDISNPLFAIRVKEIESELRKYKYSAFIINTDEDKATEEEAVITAISRKVDGIIICPSQKSKRPIKLLQEHSIPFVLMGRHFKNKNMDFVVWDDQRGGYLATKHLLDAGRKKILFLNGPSYISSALERLQGYHQAVKEAGLPVEAENIKEIGITSGSCYKILDGLISQGIFFDAIFAFSDLVAWEAICRLQEAGLRVPEDVAVIGYDDIQSNIYYPFPLASISSSKKDEAARIVGILCDRIKNGYTQKAYNEVIEPVLVIRQSAP